MKRPRNDVSRDSVQDPQKMKATTSFFLSAVAVAALAVATGSSFADQDVVLPAPIFLETFDPLNELALPTGWSVTNQTDTQIAGQDIDELRSDTYKDWIVVNA